MVIIAGLIAGVMTYSYTQATNDYISRIQEMPIAQVAGLTAERSNYILVIDSGQGEPRMYTQLIDAGQKITVLDLIRKINQHNDLQVTETEFPFGVVIESLLGYDNGTDGRYWIYYINGETAMVGVGDYEMQPEDDIQFKFEKSIF